jgi:hypothetical protein
MEEIKGTPAQLIPDEDPVLNLRTYSFDYTNQHLIASLWKKYWNLFHLNQHQELERFFLMKS